MTVLIMFWFFWTQVLRHQDVLVSKSSLYTVGISVIYRKIITDLNKDKYGALGLL